MRPLKVRHPDLGGDLLIRDDNHAQFNAPSHMGDVTFGYLFHRLLQVLTRLGTLDCVWTAHGDVVTVNPVAIWGDLNVCIFALAKQSLRETCA